MADFPIPKDGLLTFDALSMKAFLKDRLNQAGVWTDQNYEGSNISTMIDIISYTFNSLLFYLNKTSTESLFTDAQIYENMNRIVKMLDYKPIGYQSSVLSFLMSVDYIEPTNQIRTYTIPRYTYIDVNGIPFSFNEDITFSKTTEDKEDLIDLSNQKLLFQGKFQEFPTYEATGQENEIVFLTVGQNIFIDHFNIHVYVKRLGGGWKQWQQTPSLYLENSISEKFEARLNENKTYEIKFGNNINGVKLNDGDLIAIYYLESSGEDGVIGPEMLNDKPLLPFNSARYTDITNDDTEDQYDFLTDFNTITLINSTPSTYISPEESVESIRQNAPGIFRTQYRLVTSQDYGNYIRTNFANLIHDVSVANNWGYLSNRMKYYYELGISNPQNISNVLYNQTLFADSCNFNNIYITVVPKTINQSTTQEQARLMPSQKSLIMDTLQEVKTLTTEIVLLDPIYISIGLALPTQSNSVRPEDIDKTILAIELENNSRRSPDAIKEEIFFLFQDYFARENIYLGQEIDINFLTRSLYNIKGVKTFYTQRTDTNEKIEGLSMVIWNPVYPAADVRLLNQNLKLEDFKYPYLYNSATFIEKIWVKPNTATYESVEY
jgi:hypothetical protein